VGIDGYRRVLARRDARRVVLLGLVIRIPLWASNVILTLHVVTHLHRSYAAAGALTGAATVALAVSGPWLGRRLDQVGLRAVVGPALVVLVGCWSIAPFVGYWPLLGLAVVSGLVEVPTFSIVRQALMHTVPEQQRKVALSLDAVALEISFMIGPAIGVLLATYIDTSWALFACEYGSIFGGALLWAANPALRSTASDEKHVTHPMRTWVTPAFVGVLIACATATIVLTGTDVAVVAALRHMHHQSWIGWQLAVWGLGSAIGGLVYGALHRSIPTFVLLGVLAASTLPIALAHEPVTLAVLLFVAGFCCAPTLTATVEALSRVVPESVRGEALGWHGSALTVGGAIGAPMAGVAIDSVGWRGGFVLPALVGLAVTVVLTLAALRARAAAAPAPRESVVT